MSSRENILGRIRKALGREGTEPTADETAHVRAAIARHTVGPQPTIAHPAHPLAHFRAECDRLGTTHAEAPSRAHVPAEVRRYLDANDLERRLLIWHEFADLDWAAAGITVDDRTAQESDRTSLTGCFCAIAETGTLLLLSSPATPKATALVPESHICVVPRTRIVLNMEEAFGLMRGEVGEPPRATWFISGPSRTADIEQTLVIGAHGPYRVHVIVVP